MSAQRDGGAIEALIAEYLESRRDGQGFIEDRKDQGAARDALVAEVRAELASMRERMEDAELVLAWSNDFRRHTEPVSGLQLLMLSRDVRVDDKLSPMNPSAWRHEACSIEVRDGRVILTPETREILRKAVRS